MYMYVYVSECHVCAGLCGAQKRVLELRLHILVSHLEWGLGTRVRFSARKASAVNR